MPENETVPKKSLSDYDQEVVDEAQANLEEKFLKILSEPDVVIPAEEIPEDGNFTDDQRAMLQQVLEAEMPTPQEIEQRAKIAAHNAEVQRKRDERQALKRARREQGKKRRRRR